MTDTLMGVSPRLEPAGAGDDADDRTLSPAELTAVEDLVRQARQTGIALTGPGGLLKAMTKTVIEAALAEELAEHLATTNMPSRAGTGPIPATGNGPRPC